MIILATFLSLSAGAQTLELLPSHGGFGGGSTSVGGFGGGSSGGFGDSGGFGGGFNSADDQLINSGVAGPKYTSRWEQVDSSQAPKLIDETVSIRLRDELVNEIYLRADKNRVEIADVVVTLSNGQTMHLVQASGTLRSGQAIRLQLHNRFSLRLERIEMTITSPNLIGSRGQLTTQIGLVR